MKSTLLLRGELFELDQPKVMGILNINPDSFYDGGQYTSVENSIKQCGKMISEGASIIDIGPASSKPGSSLISHDEEWTMLEPHLHVIRKNFPEAYISIDTYNAQTAIKAADIGADIINDISGGIFDSEMLATVTRLNLPYIMMHTSGTPDKMQQRTQYDDLIGEMTDFFAHQTRKFYDLGGSDLILDLGFGFGKTLEDNFLLLHSIEYFQNLFELPILVGLSRKSMIYKTIQSQAKNALNATTAAHMIALQNGARILRVHDVKEATEAISIYLKYAEHISPNQK